MERQLGTHMLVKIDMRVTPDTTYILQYGQLRASNTMPKATSTDARAYFLAVMRLRRARLRKERRRIQRKSGDEENFFRVIGDGRLRTIARLHLKS